MINLTWTFSLQVSKESPCFLFQILCQPKWKRRYTNHSLLAASKSQSRREPDWEPATTRSSEPLNWIHSTGLVWPVRLYRTDNEHFIKKSWDTYFSQTNNWEGSTIMQFGLLTAQILTLQSSPPVASRRPDDFPNTSEDTLLEWATISSEQYIWQNKSQSHLPQLQRSWLLKTFCSVMTRDFVLTQFPCYYSGVGESHRDDRAIESTHSAHFTNT